MSRMNEDQHDSPPTNAMDQALMNYLDEILSDSSGRTRTSGVKTETLSPSTPLPKKVTSLEAARSRPSAPEPSPLPAKPEAKQNVTLPFRTAEKPKVLASLNLLNPKAAPEPVKTKPELVPVKTVAPAKPEIKKPTLWRFQYRP